MTTDLPAPDEPSPGLVLYTSPDGSTRFQLRIEHKTLWLMQRQLADLFQKSPHERLRQGGRANQTA